MYYLSALSSFSLNDNAKIRWFYLAMMPNKTCHEKWCQMMRNDAFWLHHFAKSTSPPLPLKVFFRKPTSPPLPLREGPPLSPSPFPLRGQGMCQPPYSVLKPLRYKVGGPSEVFASSGAAVCGMRPHGYKSLTGCLVLARSLLEACLVLARSFFENLPGFP